MSTSIEMKCCVMEECLTNKIQKKDKKKKNCTKSCSAFLDVLHVSQIYCQVKLSSVMYEGLMVLG